MPPRSHATAVTDWSPRAILLGYTALTYTSSWSLWSVRAISETGTTPTETLLFVLGGLGPFVASAVLVRTTGRYVRAWLRKLSEARVALRYYALALAFPVALFLGAAVIYRYRRHCGRHQRRHDLASPVRPTRERALREGPVTS